MALGTKILLIALLFLQFGCGAAVSRSAGPGERPEDAAKPVTLLPLGNPSGAAADPANADNYLLVHRSFAASYNNSRGTVNWVAWKTTAADLGEALPRPDFSDDLSLPPQFYRAKPSDYSRSGFDRGHLVPSADRFGDAGLNAELFLMTNVVPQTSELNQFPWQKFESYARTLVRKGYDVYAISGVLGSRGLIANRITVPASCWKILYYLPAGNDPVADSHEARVVAVDMPNIAGISAERWIKFKVSVRELEQKTGYDFLSTLAAAEQQRLEIGLN